MPFGGFYWYATLAHEPEHQFHEWLSVVFWELLRDTDGSRATPAEMRFGAKTHLDQLADGEASVVNPPPELATTCPPADVVPPKKPTRSGLKK